MITFPEPLISELLNPRVHHYTCQGLPGPGRASPLCHKAVDDSAPRSHLRAASSHLSWHRLLQVRCLRKQTLRWNCACRGSWECAHGNWDSSDRKGECDMAKTGALAEPTAHPGANKPSELSCLGARGLGLHTLQGLMAALGLSQGRGQLWVRQSLGRFLAVGQQQTTVLAAGRTRTRVVEGNWVVSTERFQKSTARGG